MISRAKYKRERTNENDLLLSILVSLHREIISNETQTSKIYKEYREKDNEQRENALDGDSFMFGDVLVRHENDVKSKGRQVFTQCK